MRSLVAILSMCALLAACTATPKTEANAGGIYGSSGHWTAGFGDQSWTQDGVGMSGHPQFWHWEIRELELKAKPEWPLELPQLVGVINHGSAHEAWFQGIDHPLHVGDFVPGTEWLIKDIFINRFYSKTGSTRTAVELWRETIDGSNPD